MNLVEEQSDRCDYRSGARAVGEVETVLGEKNSR